MILKKSTVPFFLLFCSYFLIKAQHQEVHDQLMELWKEKKYKETLKIEKSALSAVVNQKDTAAANIYFFLAEANLSTGTKSKAVDYYNQARMIREAMLPAYPGDYTDLTFNLLYAYVQVNDFEKAKSTGERLLIFVRDHYGEQSDEYLDTFNQYISVLVELDEIQQAETLLENFIKKFPEFSKQNALLISQLAELCKYSGKFLKAERLFAEALELLLVSEGEESPYYLATLSNYAALLIEQGKYDSAEELLLKVLETSRSKDLLDPEAYYATLNNFALVQQSLGLYKASEQSYRKLMKEDSATIGVKHPAFAITLSNLGLLYIDQERYQDAERVLKQSMEILKSNREAQSVSYAKKLNNLAKAYQRSGRLEEAVNLYLQAQKIFEKNFGKMSPDYATVTYNLGTTYLFQKSSKALPTLKSALEIRGKVLGKSHPLYAECEERIAQYHWQKKNRAETGSLYNNVFDNYYAQVDNYFPILTEEEKSNFFYQKIKPSLESFATFVSSDKSDAKLLGQLFDYHVNTKGIILSATEKVRKTILNSGDQSLIGLFEQWEDTKDMLTYSYSMQQSQVLIDSLIRTSDELEKDLMRRSASFAKNLDRSRVTWRNIREKLKPGEAALECLRYRVFNPDSSRFGNQINYAFLLLTAEMTDGPVLINFTSGVDMESRFLSYYRNGIRLKLDDLYSFKNFWEPVNDQLVKYKVKRVYFSPDGVYNTVNISSIKNPFTNQFIIDELEERRLTSTRSLLEPSAASKNKDTGYLFGFPTYKIPTSAGSKVQQTPTGSSRSFRGGMLRFFRGGGGIAPLPGTKTEIENISSGLQEHVKNVNINMQSDAIETNLKKMQSPYIVHIATHGYFLDDEDDEADETIVVPNPLLMAGLILAGAENFIQTGTNPLHEREDGILTAYEAMNLSLDGTKLVVLSACETGLGKVKAGEGVYGLQRAFQVAGAESIIMSLWSVDDAATQMLMSLFYEKYLNSGDLYGSFEAAQKELKKNFPSPFYWGAFVLVGTGS